MTFQDKDELCFPQLNSSCRKPTLQWSDTLLLNTVLSFGSLITVSLNLVVIISVSHFRQLHTPTNILLLSLAVSDFLVGLFLMPLEIFRFTNCWCLGDIMCSLFCYLIGQIVSTSTGNIVLISTDRYMAICDPLHYPTRITLGRVKCYVCLCWLCAAFYSFFFLNESMTQLDRSISCVGECKFVINYTVSIVGLIFNFILPITVFIVLYMRVFVVAVSQACAMRSHITAVSFHHSVTVKTLKFELKAARTLGVLVAGYLVCYCPHYCYTFVQVHLNGFLIFLFYFNSCLNPLIYALFYSWFRKATKLIVTLQILKPGSSEANILTKVVE